MRWGFIQLSLINRLGGLIHHLLLIIFGEFEIIYLRFQLVEDLLLGIFHIFLLNPFSEKDFSFPRFRNKSPKILIFDV